MTRTWHAKWIQPQQSDNYEEPVLSLAEMFAGKLPKQLPVTQRLRPVQHLKKCFNLEAKPIKKAQLFITAHGLYQAKLNGKNVTTALLTPEFTSYHHYLQYQEYDVTDLLEGENTLTILLADGWYAGRVSVNGGSNQFGNKLQLLAELVITYVDGTKQIVGSDESFVAKASYYDYSDLFIGECQDLRKKAENWLVNQDVKGCLPVEVVTGDFAKLHLQMGPQVQAKEKLVAKKIWREADGIIVDFGQVLVGVVELDVKLAFGQKITLEHSETLDENGKFFHNIMGRNKDQTDVFIGRGSRDKLRPTFTCHGFRYVKISGLTEMLSANEICAWVIASDLKTTGYLKTDNDLINKLINNIYWSQKGNMVSIPTDCPKRERMGWTGDMQVFAPTASFFMNSYDFIRRWLISVRAEQTRAGEILDFSPAPKDVFETPSLTGSFSSAGWGDAIIMVPWTLYQRYGRREVLEENYQAMLKWHDYAVKSAKGDKADDRQYLWDTKFHYGDWMFPSYMIGATAPGPMATAHATKDIFGTAFLAHSSELLAQIAGLLDDTSRQDELRAYFAKVKQAFNKYYFKEDKMTADFQGCYVIGLAFNLFDSSNKATAIKRLTELIVANNYRLDTGFLSVPYLLDVLIDNGQDDLASKLLLQEECPSWLYEVKQGATTIWESWAGIEPNGKVGRYSFNHYAFGCVGDFLVRRVAGLQVLTPGYEKFLIAPKTNLGINEFDLSYKSRFGTIKVLKTKTQLVVEVPQQTSAVLELAEVNKQPLELSSGKYVFKL